MKAASRPLSLCALLPLLLWSFGCGGTSATPASPAAPSSPGVANLKAGSYTLTVSQGSTTTPTPAGDFTSSVCLGTGSYPTTVQVPVVLEAASGTFQVRALNGSLLSSLTLQGLTVTGTMSGTAKDATQDFSIAVQGTQPASLSGSVVDGTVDGTVVAGSLALAGPNGSGGCSPLAWKLAPR